MIKDDFGELIYQEDDIMNIILNDIENINLGPFQMVKPSAYINEFAGANLVKEFIPFEGTINEFDTANQSNWYMPEEYKELDIAKYILDKCKTDPELQRVGEELMLYQEHDLFDLLRYLKYLVDTMKENNVIWGVGRGSSVSSYVLYLLEIHKVNSMYYNLDVREFLR